MDALIIMDIFRAEAIFIMNKTVEIAIVYKFSFINQTAELKMIKFHGLSYFMVVSFMCKQYSVEEIL